MLRFISSVIATALAFWIVTSFLPDMLGYDGGFWGLILLAVIFGLVNGIIGPIVKLLALPVTAITLGLFGIVINAVLLILVAWIADAMGVAFTVGDFPPDLFTGGTIIAALVGSIVLGIVNAIAQFIVPG